MKKFILAASAVLFFSACGLEQADELATRDEPLASVYVGCYVGTPGAAGYTNGSCWKIGSTTSTTVSFKLFPHQTPSYVKWRVVDLAGNPRSISCSGVVCNATIHTGETLLGHAEYYVVNGIPIQGAAADAYYEMDH